MASRKKAEPAATPKKKGASKASRRRPRRGGTIVGSLANVKPDGFTEPYRLKSGKEIQSVYQSGCPHCPTCERKLGVVGVPDQQRQLFLEEKEARLRERLRATMERDIRLLQQTYRQKGAPVPSSDELFRKLVMGELSALTPAEAQTVEASEKREMEPLENLPLYDRDVG